METVIDWSKAPDWATQVGLNHYTEQAWIGDDGYSYLMGNGGVVPWSYEAAYARTEFKIMQVRPRLPVWTGEGLPPIGMVCEHHKFGRAITSGADAIVKIIAHITDDKRISPVAVYMPCEGNPPYVGQGTADAFRPIRTPEQIAADEHRSKYMQQLEKLWDADTGREEFLESVYAMISEAHKP